MNWQEKLTLLNKQLNGELYFDTLHKAIYATDASVYRELPLAVAYPRTKEDIAKLIAFAKENNTTLIPRTAGTSLAGQCVGNGIVVDVSKHFTQIIELNEKEKWVRVQPGVIRDELNQYLKPYGLFFGPETSTANRAMIGGMVGNNSTGSNSIKYGNTRDHVLELEAFLSDGNLYSFSALNQEAFNTKCKEETQEGNIYRFLNQQLSNKEVQEEIYKEFPRQEIHRRNTGYALDELLHCNLIEDNKEDFNLCKLLCGSEGTLAFTTEIKLNLLDLPPKESVLLCPHFNSVNDALKAVQIIMKFEPYACELMDKVIMDCTKENSEYKKYRFFIEGEPKAVLMVELRAETKDELSKIQDEVMQAIDNTKLAYACPAIFPPQTTFVWNLRKAGLGLLANIPGDKKAVAVIEDTAVYIDDLPQYIEEFTAMMKKHGQEAVYYAHAGAGEIHLRPILDLKKTHDVTLFKEIAWDTARLVKKYKGSLSGEHGDGRVRASFIPYMLGEKNYQLLIELKQTFDPQNIFNAGKIIDAPPIEEDLRYKANREEPTLNTFLNFEDEGGLLLLAEKCNGSGDCRKTHLSGGAMCPSYMASKDEKDTTRARANALREFLTHNDTEREKWSSTEIKEALDLCLSCKACKNECPSNVDMAVMKAEFTYQYNKINGTPWRNKAFASIGKLNQLGMIFPAFTNAVNNSFLAKKIMGIAPERNMPRLPKQTFTQWFAKRKGKTSFKRKVYFFADEFTNYYDVESAKKMVGLFEKLQIEVLLAPIKESGRSYISKGLLKEAKAIANVNYSALKGIITEETPLIGLEPSAILSFRDEYVRMVNDKNYKESTVYNFNCTLEEFLDKEIQRGSLHTDLFTTEHKQVKLHVHCHQKALSNPQLTQKLLSLPKNYHVEMLPTACCGMAGSFGYEKEHYNLSMQIGNLVLFPAMKQANNNEILCATGTSCRHQIEDGINKKAVQVIDVLFGALI
ncbi:MAG: FAD-binding protein [Chitinophagales bacterium]|nr:FAD-binding protein [Chitinophagales bacterium]